MIYLLIIFMSIGIGLCSVLLLGHRNEKVVFSPSFYHQRV